MGNTDANFSHRFNQLLSEKRAKLINNYLERRGISAERYEIVRGWRKEYCRYTKL